MSQLTVTLMAAIVAALVTAAGMGFLVSRQVSALAAKIDATFEGLDKRLELVNTALASIDTRLGRLETRAMSRLNGGAE